MCWIYQFPMYRIYQFPKNILPSQARKWNDFHFALFDSASWMNFMEAVNRRMVIYPACFPVISGTGASGVATTIGYHLVLNTWVSATHLNIDNYTIESFGLFSFQDNGSVLSLIVVGCCYCFASVTPSVGMWCYYLALVTPVVGVWCYCLALVTPVAGGWCYCLALISLVVGVWW